MKKASLGVIICCVVLSFVGCKPWTVVKNEKSNEDSSSKVYFESDDFDSEAFVKDVWDNKLLDYYNKKKVDIKKLVEDLKNDEVSAKEKYGLGSNEMGSNWTFIVEGNGKTLDVDTSSRAGVMSIDLEPFDGQSDLLIQIGPVIKGSSIRDSLDFIKLDNFSNQVEFASVSKEFNSTVVSETISDNDYSKNIGKNITFMGCFTYANLDDILVTPVELNAGEGQ
ncbi:MAG: DUF2291 domain-containing protein [Clostridiales bacterium]